MATKKIAPKKKPKSMDNQILEGDDLQDELNNPSMQGPYKPFEDPEMLNEGGEVRGGGAAIRGKGFKGVF
jgi:hypothetical protein|tara:strand:- start:61 stop:270 length:210 start_codon:yes stop_codon:yes gene_type:complete